LTEIIFQVKNHAAKSLSRSHRKKVGGGLHNQKQLKLNEAGEEEVPKERRRRYGVVRLGNVGEGKEDTQGKGDEKFKKGGTNQERKLAGVRTGDSERGKTPKAEKALIDFQSELSALKLRHGEERSKRQNVRRTAYEQERLPKSLKIWTG